VALACLVATWATWPLVAHLRTQVARPGSGGILDVIGSSDVFLTHWILAWDTHALRTAPTRLLDANIFWPAPRTLALSEHMLGFLPLYLPLALASHDPVFAHQGTLLLTFVCAWLAAFALVVDWTGSWPAGLVAAACFAFSGFRAANVADLHVEGAWLLPLIPLCARRALAARAWRAQVALGCVLVLQALSSYYLGYGAFLVAAVIIAVAFATTPGNVVWKRLVPPVACASLVTAASAAPYLWARLALPPPELLALSSARPLHTGATPALVLAVLTASWWRRGVRRDVPAMWVATVALASVSGHALALGPAIRIGSTTLPGPYALVARLVPGLSRVRVPIRFNAVATMGLATLAGVGVSGLLRTASGRGRAAVRVGAFAIAVSAILLEFPSTLPLQPIETRATVPPIYAWLRTAEPGPVVELPFHDVDLAPLEKENEARRVYRSVYHWHPLLNGYSGYTPATYAAVSGLVRALPDPRALSALVRLTGVRHVIVHGDDPRTTAQLGGLAQAGSAVRVGDDVAVTLPGAPADLLPGLLAGVGDAGTTLLGTPLASPTSVLRADVAIVGEAPASTIPGVTFMLACRFTNASQTTWPALSGRSEHLVTAGYRWEDGQGLPIGGTMDGGRLPFDLGPGESIVTEVPIRPPDVVAEATVQISAVRDGVWLDGRPASARLRLERYPPRSP
jgi:hypothetical protein